MSPVVQLLKRFPKFCGNWRYITVITKTHHLSVSRGRLIHSILPHPLSLRSNWNIHPPSGFLLSGFPINYGKIISLVVSTICPTSIIHLSLITILLFVTSSLLRRHNTIRCLVSNKSSSVTFRNNGLSMYAFSGNEGLCWFEVVA
jgi:hypothetical protein